MARRRAPWSTRAGAPAAVALASIGVAGAMAAVGVLPSGPAGASGGAAHGTRAHGLVGYPSFLPAKTLHYDGDALLTGTARRPAVTSQGDPIRVVTPHWSVQAVVSGPEVPGEGLPYQAPTTTCTWTVTLSKASGPVPVDVADFNSIDVSGDVFHPALVPGQPSPPTVLEPGRTTTFEIRAAEPAAEGLMRWAPGGKHIVAKWDFVVEND